MSATPVLPRPDSPAVLEPTPDDLVAQSAAILQAAGYRVLPISRPIGPFEILAVNAFSLLLCCVVKDAWPETALGFGRPPGWPHNLLRQIHKWTDGVALPETLSLDPMR